MQNLGHYLFMNKDTVIAELYINYNVIKIVKINKNIPIFNDIEQWIYNRLSPFGRYNISKILKGMGVNSREDYIKVTKAISLTDTFWIKEKDSNLNWDDINPYNHSLSRNIANIALGLGYNGSPLKSPTPEPRNDGSFDKCWKRINGITYLYKSGGEKWSDNTGNESYSEVLVNQVAFALGLPLNSFVRYECMEKFVNNRKFIICRCPSFTSEDIGFLPIENTGLASVDIMTQYKAMLKCNSGVQFLAMLLLDSLTMNVDRHTGNYGFLFSTDNLKIIKMAPIFDNNLALIPKVSIKDKEALAYSIRNARPSGDHFGDFIEQGKFVLSIQPKFRERLNYINNLKFRIDNGMESLSIDRLKLLEALVKRQASLILK